MADILGALVILGAVAWLGRLADRCWTSPAVLFTVLWWGYCGTALLFIVDRDPIAPAVLWIAAACGAMLLGSWASTGFQPTRVPGASSVDPSGAPARIELPFLTLVTAALAVLAFAEIVLVFRKAGSSLGGLASFAVLTQLSSLNRYSYGYGDLQQGLLERVLFACTYAAPLFGGALFRLGASRSARALGASTLVLAALVATLYGSRMGVLFGGSFWIASYTATQVLLGVATVRGGRSFMIRIIAVAGSLILGLSVVAMIVRYFASADRSRTVLWMLGDAFGFFAAFASWFSGGGWHTQEHLYGYRTFMRFYQAAGVQYDWPAPVELGFTNSNIYTVFRGLIEDFGMGGALLALVVLGFVGGCAYRRVMAGYIRWLPALAMVYSFVLISFSFSIFTYTTPTVALLAFALYFGLAVPRRLAPATPGGTANSSVRSVMEEGLSRG